MGEEVLDLSIDNVLDLLGKLLSLAAEGLGRLGDLARDNVKLVLDLGVNVLGLGGGALGVKVTSLDNLLVVAAAGTVPGENVGGVGVNVGKAVLGTNGDEVLLELSGGDGGNSVLGVGSGLERQVVGQETTDVGRGHGGTGDGVDGVLGADPSGLNVQTGGKDVGALAVVGEVGTAVVNGGGTNGNSLLGGGRRVVAGIGVIVASSDGEMETLGDGSIDSHVKKSSLATTERHIGDRALEALALTGLGLFDLVLVRLGGPVDALDDIGHGARAVGAKNLDGIDVGLLGDTVLLTSNGAGAVSTVAIAVLVGITEGSSVTPLGTALKVDVLSVGTSVNNISVDTLTTLFGVEVLVEGTEAQSLAVGDTGKTPRSLLLGLGAARVLGDSSFGADGDHGVDDGVALNGLDLDEMLDDGLSRRWSSTYVRVVADLLDNGIVKVTSIPAEAGAEIKSVLHASEGILDGVEKTTLAELEAILLAVSVNVTDPGMVSLGLGLVNVLLKLDDVGAGNGVRVGGIEDRGRVVVNGTDLEGRSLGKGGHGEGGDNGLHDDGCAGLWRGMDDAGRPAVVFRG